MIPPSATQGQRTIVVFAASSLTNVFEDIADDFESANPGVEVLFSFGGSSVIAAQLVEGAPADVFASANTEQMEIVRNAGRIAGETVTFARNRLALIVPSGNPAGIESVRDLARPGVKLVVGAVGVPIRAYMDSMFELLAADPSYGDVFVAGGLANIVSEEQNVRQVVAKLALGEGDAGIVYHSDVIPNLADQVIAIPIPDSVNPVADYPIAVIEDASQPELAAAFVDYMLSEAGQAVMLRWNFLPGDDGKQVVCGA